MLQKLFDEGTTNLSPNPTLATGITGCVGYNCNLSYAIDDGVDDSCCVRGTLTASPATISQYVSISSPVVGMWYAFCVMVRATAGKTIQCYVSMAGGANPTANGTAVNLTSTGAWQYINTKMQVDYADRSEIRCRAGLVGAVGDVYKVDCYQVEQKDHSTAFVVGTRPDKWLPIYNNTSSKPVGVRVLSDLTAVTWLSKRAPMTYAESIGLTCYTPLYAVLKPGEKLYAYNPTATPNITVMEV